VALEGGGEVVFDAEHVRESILDPRRKLSRGFQPLMPTYVGQLNEEQILALIAYIESLPPEGGQ
jgi:cytochrome c oxidase subunit 2